MLSFIVSIFFGISSYSSPVVTSLPSRIDRTDTLTTDSLRLITIDNIIIEGNKKTKNKIISREIELKHGDTVRQWRLEAILKKDRNRIYNTRLFNSTEVYSTIKDDGTADIYVKVEERWYFFPVIILELADPNFNIWWQQRNHDLTRLEYGVRLTQKNFRGRNEDLRATVQVGFTKKIEFSYNIPYIDRSQKNGIRLITSYSTNNNINYKTKDHVLMPAQFDTKIRERWRSGVRWSHRQAFYSYHAVEGNYFYTHISDTLAQLNPNYLGDGRTSQRYFSLRYEFKHDFRDVAAYPLKGNTTTFTAEKLGFTKYEDLDQWDFTAEHIKYTSLGHNFFLANQVKGRVSFPRSQPYFNLRALGYRQDFVRGYDLNVIEGQSYFLSKNTLRKRVANRTIYLDKILRWKQFNKVPYAIYLKTYFDMGYVYNQMYYPENQRLINKLLPGGGFGIDLVTFYDLVMRFEASVNKEGQAKFFFHIKTDI